MRNACLRLVLSTISVVGLFGARTSLAQTPDQGHVEAIRPPTTPLPDEAASRDFTKFSFIAYGDTRGRRDGIAVQYEHSLLVDSMLHQINKLAGTEYPVKFVIQIWRRRRRRNECYAVECELCARDKSSDN